MTPEDRQRYATVGSAFLGKVAQRLTSLNPEELSAADVARWTDVAVKLQQLGQEPGRYDREGRIEASLIPEGRVDWSQIQTEEAVADG